MWRAFRPSLRPITLVRSLAPPPPSSGSRSFSVSRDPALRARALAYVSASAAAPLPAHMSKSNITEAERAQKASEALAMRLAKLQATQAKTANAPPVPLAQMSAQQQSKPRTLHYPLTRRWLPITTQDKTAAGDAASSASASAAAAAPSLPLDALPLTLLSYNLLAQSLVRRDLFPYASRASLKVAFRRDNLLAELLEADADVMALQEVDADLMSSFWSKRLEAAGYKWEWGSRRENAKHGCAIFYKKAKFERFASVVIQYGEELGAPYVDLPDNQGDEWAARRGSVYAEMSRPNVGQIVGLRVKEPAGASSSGAAPMGLYVANTHLFWDPRYRFVRLKQCQTLLDRLASLQNAEGTSYPSALLGDFNVTPDNIIYNYLTAREELQHNEECWAKFLTPAEHGSMGRGDGEAAPPVVDPQEAKANGGISSASLARLVEAVSLSPASSPSPSPSPPGTTTALPFGGATPLEQLRTELVQQADGSVKVRDVEPHVDHSSVSSVLRLSEVKAVLHHSKQLPLLQSLYANYAQIVPSDAQGSLARSQASSYCRWSKEPPYTNYTQKFKGTLDYIFLPVHNPASDLDDPEAESAAAGAGADAAAARTWAQILSAPSCYLQPTHLLELPGEEMLMDATALPNDVVSSDHVCIAARVVMSRSPMQSHAPTPAKASAPIATAATTSAASAAAASSSSSAPAALTASPKTIALARSIADSLMPSLPSAALSAAPASFAPFKPALFQSLNRSHHIGKTLHYESTVTSTMDLCKDALFGPNAAKKPQSGTIWLADEQTKGRGRIEGRSWSSPRCANLYFTLLIQLPSSGALQASAFEALRKMNQCVCLSVAQSIESALQSALGLSPSQPLPAQLQPKIKWPNDVWIGGKKCCGVLIDVEHCAGEMNVVIGVGINVHEDMRSHPDAALRESATSVSQALRDYRSSTAAAAASSSTSSRSASTPISRESLLASFVTHLDAVSPQSLSSVLSLYERYDMLLGQRIVVMPRKREDTESYYEATAVGYSPDGYLVVQTDAGERTELVAEEVTIRPAKNDAARTKA